MESKQTLRRLKILLGIFSIIFTVLIWRFGEVQLLETRKYKTLSEQNRIRLVTLKAPRGEIRDHKGRLLVRNKVNYVVSINDMGDNDLTIQAVQKVNKFLKLSPNELNKIIKEIKKPWRRRFEPVRLMENVPSNVVAQIQEQKLELDGVLVDLEPVRQYVYFEGGPVAPHLIGFTNRINDLQWEKNKSLLTSKGYSLNDRIGQSGLEKFYEDFLKGKDGARQIEVDANFRPVRELATLDPVGGHSLFLTIDAKLQRLAESALDKYMILTRKEHPKAKAGALVMLDVRTGAVLAMASRPGFDPNMFSRKITQAEVDAMYREKEFPAAINRAMYDYAPGSTFKMVTAIAGLESKKIDIYQKVNDRGGITVGDKSFYCWLKSGHGPINLEKAMEVSCNTYFYQQGQRIGIKNIEFYAKELGLGEKTLIDLPDEKRGIRPSPQKKLELKGPLYDALLKAKIKEIGVKYSNLINKAPMWEKEKKLKQKQKKLTRIINNYRAIKAYETSWQRYDTVITSIGQGLNSYSPLQLANYAAVIATKGKRIQPFLVEKIKSIDGKLIYQHRTQALPRAKISLTTFNTIRDDMYGVTHGPRGTAASTFRYFPIKVAGKTGTAQNPPRDNNALFVGFAPFDNPQVAIAVIVEQGGHGGDTAAPIAREVLASYFKIVPKKQKNHGTTAKDSSVNQEMNQSINKKQDNLTNALEKNGNLTIKEKVKNTKEDQINSDNKVEDDLNNKQDNSIKDKFNLNGDLVKKLNEKINGNIDGKSIKPNINENNQLKINDKINKNIDKNIKPEINKKPEQKRQ